MNSKLVHITPVGSGLYLLQEVGRTDPGYGRPGGGGRPDQGLPGYGHPDQGLPGYGHPDQGLPGYGHPDQGLPGQGGYPSQGLPGGGGYPSQGLPGQGGRPSHPISIPLPPDLGITQPIVLPERPQLPENSGVVMPVPPDVTLPAPKEGTDPSHKPYVLWYGPGTQSQLVYLPPSQQGAQPK